MNYQTRKFSAHIDSVKANYIEPVLEAIGVDATSVVTQSTDVRLAGAYTSRIGSGQFARMRRLGGGYLIDLYSPLPDGFFDGIKFNGAAAVIVTNINAHGFPISVYGAGMCTVTQINFGTAP